MPPVPWIKVSVPPPLHPAAIHCWQVPVQGGDRSAAHGDKAQLRRRERAAAQQWRALLNRHYQGHPETRLRSLAHSTAHACGVLLLAYALDRRIGVDLESLDRRVDPAMQQRLLKLAAMPGTGLGAPEFRPHFFRVWTRLEAHAKATGTGLRFPLRHIPVPWAEGAVQWAETRPDGDTAVWQAVDFTLENGLAAALVHDGAPAAVAYFTPADALLRC